MSRGSPPAATDRPAGGDAGLSGISSAAGLLERLVERLRDIGPFAIAFSGGLDSSVLCAAASHAPGVSFAALTADTPFTPRSDIAGALELASALGFRHSMVRFDPLDDVEIRVNPPDRCYLCKRMILSRLSVVAASLGLPVLCDGTNADDAGSDRPGLRALREAGVRSPLAELGYRRKDVVEMARVLGVPDPDRRNVACLATRIPHGTMITPGLLATVEDVENSISSLGFSLVRLRTDGRSASVELAAEELEAAPGDGRLDRIEPVVAEARLILRGIGPYRSS